MPNLAEQTLIRFGRDGLVVTVPKAWASYYRLRPGDKVEVVTDTAMVTKPIAKGQA